MVRLSDLTKAERDHLLAKACKPFESSPWVTPPALKDARIALVTSAGLHRVDDAAFDMHDVSYRVIPGDVEVSSLTMTHSSVHFDRQGFREDINTVLPLEPLKDLARDGEIGSVAAYHYSFMGAGWLPQEVESSVDDLAQHLKADNVDAVCVIPV